MSENKDFLRNIVEEDLKNNKYNNIVTRFPPEPNGFPHIGHAKSIAINFGIAKDYDGHCNLRMDDTNPTTEDTKYVEALKDAVQWLGFDWEDREYYASDYFEQLYGLAVQLIEKGKAYVYTVSESKEEYASSKLNDLYEGLFDSYGDVAITQFLDTLEDRPEDMELLKKYLKDK